jgi:5S rRNA maturation endonuclease (ribonuclease M5)
MVTPQYIKDFLNKFFKNIGKLSSNGREYMMPSIFIDNDWKNHFSINTETGLWQDFKTGQSGNFVQFVSIVENIPYNKAQAKLLFYEFEHGSYEEPDILEEEIPLEMPQELLPVNINSHSDENPYIKKAWIFLYQRGLFNTQEEEETPFYICTKGKYKNRLIIPFVYDDEMFYFQARALEWETPKYLNPTGTYVKPSNILYPFNAEEDYVVVCEGPLDALSLQRQGVNATATMGSSVSEVQAQTLSEFGGKIIMGYDNDEAGKRGLEKFERLRKINRMSEFYVCTPPSSYKDWNEAHQQEVQLKNWVEKYTQKYDYEYINFTKLNSL